MKRIYILGFGCADEGGITLKTMSLLKECRKVFVRTVNHPAAAILDKYKIQYTGFDSLYERAESFEEVYETIAKEVTGAPYDEICYIVPGSAVFAERSVKLILDKAEEDATLNVQIIPAVSFIDGILAALKMDGINSFKVIDALSLDRQQPDVSTTNIVCQVYDKSTASDVKLALMEHYSDDTPVILITGALTGGQIVERLKLHEIDRSPNINHLTSLIIPPADYRRAPASFYNLKQVFSALRSENGCEWDKVQTHASLQRNLIEEAYEVIDAIERADYENLCEELGDLLLQIMLHAQIASESGYFNADGVVRTLCEKIIRRHPHVFGGADRDADLEELWEKVKEDEHSYKLPSEKMLSVARSLPALMYAQKIQSKAAKVGFDFENALGAMDKLAEESGELACAIKSKCEDNIREEAGDVLFAALNSVRLLGLDAEQTLKDSALKFIRRFVEMERLLANDGESFENMDIKGLETYWQNAKKKIKI